MSAIDFEIEDCRALKNKSSSEALLALLIQHHGTPTDLAVQEEIIPEPEPEPIPEPVELPNPRGGQRTAFQKWIESFEPIPQINKYPTVHSIKRCVAEQFKVPVMDLESSRRTAKIAFARQVAMYLIKELTPRSFPDIGRKFGNRDHSTAMHACRKISDMIAADQEFAGVISMLAAKVQS